MPRRGVRKRVSAHANAAKHERRYASAEQPRLKTQVKVRIASCSADSCTPIYNAAQPLLQAARLSVFSATLLDYHASDDDGVLDERRFAPLPRAGVANLGNTCFLSSSVQLLAIARPLIAARFVTAPDSHAARAASSTQRSAARRVRTTVTSAKSKQQKPHAMLTAVPPERGALLFDGA